MPSRLREPFGKAGLIVAIVALVASLAGGAIAADLATDSGKRNSKRAKKNKKKKAKGVTVAQVRKISKQEAQKYANSNPGPAGPQGPAGPAGSAGAKGDEGDNGSNGSSGSNGVSVTSEEFTGVKDGHCTGVGGSKFTAADGSTYACNGAAGSPWTAGGTLPAGETETGVWNFGMGPEESVQVPISFPLPVAGAVEPILVEGASASGCPGVVAGLPTSDPGKLCLYMFKLASGELAEEQAFYKPYSAAAFPEFGVGPSGTIVAVGCEEGGPPCVRVGTWAVTAPEV